MNKEDINDSLKKIEEKGLSYLSFLPVQIQKNDILIKEVLNRYGANSLKYFNTSIIDDPKYILKYFYKYNRILELTNVWKNNKTIALKLIKKMNNPNLYLYFSNELKNDKDIVIEIVSKYPSFYEKINNNLKDDMDVFLATLNSKKLEKRIMPLKHAGEKIRKNEDLVLLSISKNSVSFKYADDTLKSNKKIALYAVGTNLYNMNYIDEAFKNDKEFMFSVISKYKVKALPYVEKTLLNDKNFVIILIDIIGTPIVSFASDEIKDDREILKYCIENEIENLKNNYYVSVDLVYSIIKNKLKIDDSEKELVIKGLIKEVLNKKNTKRKVLIRNKYNNK